MRPNRLRTFETDLLEGQRLSDLLPKYFNLSGNAIKPISAWESEIIVTLKEDDDPRTWPSEINKLHFMCQKLCKSRKIIFDPDFEFVDFMDAWRQIVLLKMNQQDDAANNVDQQIEDELDDRGYTLTDILYDQLNLNPGSETKLKELERTLIADVERGASEDYVLHAVRAFCRANPGKGFYDPHNSMTYLVKTWYDHAITNYSDDELFGAEEQYNHIEQGIIELLDDDPVSAW